MRKSKMVRMDSIEKDTDVFKKKVNKLGDNRKRNTIKVKFDMKLSKKSEPKEKSRFL